jgi:hypothetical protein
MGISIRAYDPFKTPCCSLCVPALPRLAWRQNLQSGNTKAAVITNHCLTRGLFNRLDGVIAYPEEITNPRLWFGTNQAVSQSLRARYA